MHGSLFCTGRRIGAVSRKEGNFDQEYQRLAAPANKKTHNFNANVTSKSQITSPKKAELGVEQEGKGHSQLFIYQFKCFARATEEFSCMTVETKRGQDIRFLRHGSNVLFFFLSFSRSLPWLCTFAWYQHAWPPLNIRGTNTADVTLVQSWLGV